MEILKAEPDAINLWDWLLAENPRPDVLEQDASVARFFRKIQIVVRLQELAQMN